MSSRAGLKRVVKTVQTKNGPKRQTFWVRSGPKRMSPAVREPRSSVAIEARGHVRAYRNHFAMNLGQGVRDTGLALKDAAYHAKNLAANVWYGLTPPQLNGHTRAQVRAMQHGTVRFWYGQGRR